MISYAVQYEDEDHDKVVLASDNDLLAAVEHAKLSGWKVKIDLCTFKSRITREDHDFDEFRSVAKLS